MPQSVEEIKEYKRNYYQQNKEKMKENSRRNRHNNIERARISRKKYSDKPENKLKKKEYCQRRNKTELGKKLSFKNDWKTRGLNIDNFEEIYARYESTLFCDLCRCDLDQSNKSKKCMDHCHLTGEFRNVVCWNCNINVIK